MNTLFKEGLSFAVEKLNTPLTLSDLIVKDETCNALNTMAKWLQVRKRDTNSISTFTNTFSGFRAVFSGPAGTGKTMAASLLGNETGYDVYLIDLLSVVSKYIGETEKSMETIFSRAEVSDVILFFNHADALFGKPVDMEVSHGSNGSMEVSRLLEQIETFKGILILSFDKIFNINSPFFKWFNLVVGFEEPDSSQRLKLWRKYLPMPVQQEMGFEVDEIARKYKLTGGEIVDTIRSIGGNKTCASFKVLLQNELQLKYK